MLNFLIDTQQDIEKMRDTLLTFKENESDPLIKYHEATTQDTLEYAMKNLEVCIQAEIEKLPPPPEELMVEEYKENGRLFDLCCGIREFQKIVLPVFWRNQEHPTATCIREVVNAYWEHTEDEWNVMDSHPKYWYEDLDGINHNYWLDYRFSPMLSDYDHARRRVYNYRTRLVDTRDLLALLRPRHLESNFNWCGDGLSALDYYDSSKYKNERVSDYSWKPDIHKEEKEFLPPAEECEMTIAYNKTDYAIRKQKWAKMDWGIEQLRTKTGKVYKKRVVHWAKLIIGVERDYQNWGARQHESPSLWKMMELFKKNKYDAYATLGNISSRGFFHSQYYYSSWGTPEHAKQPLAYHHEGIY
jgi:hypothetical protein